MQSPESWCIAVGHCRVADISPEQGRTPPALAQTSQSLCPTLQQSSAVVPQCKGHALEEGRKEGEGEEEREGGRKREKREEERERGEEREEGEEREGRVGRRERERGSKVRRGRQNEQRTREWREGKCTLVTSLSQHSFACSMKSYSWVRNVNKDRKNEDTHHLYKWSLTKIDFYH